MFRLLGLEALTRTSIMVAPVESRLGDHIWDLISCIGSCQMKIDRMDGPVGADILSKSLNMDSTVLQESQRSGEAESPNQNVMPRRA